MGTSPRAKLFYGYVWGEDEEPDGETTVDAAVEALVAVAGVDDPWTKRALRGTHEEYRAFADAHKSEIDAWRAATEKAKKELGVDWGINGSDGFLRHHLYALDSLIEVEWSNTKEIDLIELHRVENIMAADAHKLDKYLKDANITRPAGVERPAWHLACLYF